MRLPWDGEEEAGEVDVDIMTEDDLAVEDGVEKEEDPRRTPEEDSCRMPEEDARPTPIHALIMALHDLASDPSDSGGLGDAWRGLLSRDGMDVLGGWVGGV